MDFQRRMLVGILGAIVAFLLQILLAPYIMIAHAMPNFVAVFIMLLAVTRPQTFGCVLPFVLGLIFDFVSGGPIGAMAFSLTLMGMVAARFFNTMNNDTLFMPLATMAVGLVLTEFIYGIFMLAMGYDAGVLSALFTRALPCGIYDSVFACVLYPLAVRFFIDEGPTKPPIADQLR